VPMTLRSRRPTNHDIAEDMKTLGGIMEIQPGAHVYETTVPLTAGQTVEYGLLGLPAPQVDAEGKTGSYRFPPLPPGGQPGVAFQWIEIEGPVAPAVWPPLSHRILFDELGVSPAPAQPKPEASRLLRRFLRLAVRGPAPEETVRRFEQLVFARLDRGEPFTEAMLAGYQAILCSDLFLYLREPNDNFAVADRLPPLKRQIDRVAGGGGGDVLDRMTAHDAERRVDRRVGMLEKLGQNIEACGDEPEIGCGVFRRQQPEHQRHGDAGKELHPRVEPQIVEAHPDQQAYDAERHQRPE